MSFGSFHQRHLSGLFINVSLSVFHHGPVRRSRALWPLVFQKLTPDILRHSGGIAQSFNDTLLIFGSRIIKLIIIILQSLFLFRKRDILKQNLQLIHEFCSVHNPVLPSNRPVILSEY